MFIDYYAVLDVPETVTLSEIKKAYKIQAFKWHPDRNSDIDTTWHMQLINEAYLILSDEKTRERYDKEYLQFKKNFTQRVFQRYKDIDLNRKEYEYKNYTIKDDILNDKVNDARKKASGLLEKSLEDLMGMIKAGTKAALDAAKRSICVFFIVQLFIIIIYVIILILNELYGE